MKLKAASINIEHGGVLMDDLLTFIRSEDPDILCMQEVHTGSRKLLEPRLKTLQHFVNELDYPFQFFTPIYRDYDNTVDGSSYSGMAILSKVPITNAKSIYFDLPYSETYRDSFENAPNHPAGMQYVELSHGNTRVNVFNVHGPWDLDGDNFGARRQAMRDSIVSETKDMKSVLLMGDTNAKNTNAAFGQLEPLVSVFGERLTTTFNMKRKTLEGYATAAVDMMFVSDDVAVISSECPAIEISDHLPLIATFDIGRTD